MSITVITVLIILASQALCVFIGYLKSKSVILGNVADIIFIICYLLFVENLVSLNEIFLSLVSLFFLIDARINLYNIERDLR